MNKYELEDLLAIKEGTLTIRDVALKYETSEFAVKKALTRSGIYLKKKTIIIHTPYGAKKCFGIREVADELNLSQWSIKQALSGKRVKTIEDLDIKLEVIDNGKH